MPDTAAFSPRQRVSVKSAMGSAVYTGRIVKWHGADALDGRWYVVKFDDGASLSVHASNMVAA